MPKYPTIGRALAALVVATVGALGAGVPEAGATAVSTEAALRAAFANTAETSITLAANVTLHCGEPAALTRNSANPITVSGAFTITQTCPNNAVVELASSGRLTLTDVTLVGTTGNSAFGVHNDNAPVTLNHVKITGTGGDAIEADSGSVTLNSSSIVDGSLDGIDSFGGAISLTRSTIADMGGDGIASNGNVTSVDSTVADNGGNGIDSNGRNLLTNTTVTGNDGDGVATANSMALTYSTITNNNRADSNGFNVHHNGRGTFVMFASVIAQNGFGPNCDEGAKVSNGFNFSDDASCNLQLPSDKEKAGSPKLGALASNGGGVETLLPLAGSPLVDAIPKAHCHDDAGSKVSTDARGVARPQVNGCDIGAVEVAASGGTTTTVAPPTTAAAPVTTAAAPATTVAAPAELPRTGSSSLPLGLAGAVVLGAGLALGYGTRGGRWSKRP
jgi:hypothetical protein